MAEEVTVNVKVTGAEQGKKDIDSLSESTKRQRKTPTVLAGRSWTHGVKLTFWERRLVLSRTPL